MKVFWDINLCWNKALSIHTLFSNNVKIPLTIIIEKSCLSQIVKWDIFSCNKYIIRPSYINEDQPDKSNAWKYDSQVLNNINDIIVYLWNTKQAAAYIIQEFIECEKYGVYFTHNPNSILLAGYYEFSNSHGGITSWKETVNNNISYLLDKELLLLWKNIVNIFNSPQDIELWIKRKQIYIFQSRPITSWNNTIYNNSELITFHWKYSLFDFDELGKQHDYFSYQLIKDIIPCIFINNKIFIKKSFTNIYYIIKYLLQSKNIKNSNFHKEYKLYLMNKYLYKLKYIFNNIPLNTEILKNFYTSNIYSFNLNQESKITPFTWNIQDKKTSDYIKIENLKSKAFFQLEKIKKQYKIDNNTYYNKYLDNNIISSDYLIFNRWILINNIPYQNTNIWVYKSVITWTLISKDNIHLSNKKDNILFLENFDIEIYEILDKIKWIIIKNWNQLSHNSIVIREYKIPCIIQYDKYNALKEWKKITIK